MFRHVFYKAGTATMAPLKKLQTFKGEACDAKDISSLFGPVLSFPHWVGLAALWPWSSI